MADKSPTSPQQSDTVLLTERLRLGPWEDRHIPPFAELNADPEIMRFFPGTLTYEETEHMVARMRSHYARHSWTFFAVELQDTNEFAGMVGLNNVGYETPFTPAVEIGWRIARQHQRKGYAMEAADACLAFAFETLGRNEIVSFTPEQNQPSWRVMERLGMVRDLAGDFDHPLVPLESPLRRHRLYTITADQWRQARGLSHT